MIKKMEMDKKKSKIKQSNLPYGSWSGQHMISPHGNIVKQHVKK